MRRFWIGVLVTFGFFGSQASSAQEGETLLGFTRNHGAAQLELEAQFDSALNAEDLGRWMKRMSAKPHHVGSPYGKENAEFLASLFRSWGFDTRIEVFKVLFPVPKTRLVEMIEPERYWPKLQEPTLAEDATSGITKNRLPTYNAYAAAGDVTAELVYVNQGIPRDYEELQRRGISVEGKIVIARYGGSWRGIKPKVAREHGALGCIIYSDPRDDGYFQGDVYPKGSFRNPQGVQRGSVVDMPLYPGDPLTPGIGADDDAKRLPVEEAATIMKIPVLPISYADARPLLQALGGPAVPPSWRGALPMTYHIGPGPAKVRIKLEFEWNLVPAYDVIATAAGSDYPDEWVIRGNHHDGWVFGAADPLSGLVALMEEARALGELMKSGWKPKRTIVYAAWDGEEPGLLGSTEWAEEHGGELKKKAVVYINTDSNGRGFLSMGGSHTLERFINQVARNVLDPQTKVSVLERLRALRRVNDNQEVDTRSDLRISPLGSGSDYTPFLQHLGIAALNLGFGGENRGGSYHSIFDSFDYYRRFGDPGFQYGVTLAKVVGRTVLRIANADVLPFSFLGFADNVSRYAKGVDKLAADMRQQTARTNQLIDNRAYRLAADPTQTYNPPRRKPPVPFLNFAPLLNSLARLEQSAKAYDEALATWQTAAVDLPAEQRDRLNQVLLHVERAMTRDQGLPRRPWFKHHIYAPGFYTGYGVKTIPGVREAIEQRDWKEASEQVSIAAGTLDRVSEDIQHALQILSGTP